MEVMHAEIIEIEIVEIVTRIILNFYNNNDMSLEFLNCQGLIKKQFIFFFKINLFILFIYFWLRGVFIAARGLSLVAVRGGYSSLRQAGFHCGGFSCCTARALGARASVVVARGLSSGGSRALERRLRSCGARA